MSPQWLFKSRPKTEPLRLFEMIMFGWLFKSMAESRAKFPGVPKMGGPPVIISKHPRMLVMDFPLHSASVKWDTKPFMETSIFRGYHPRNLGDGRLEASREFQEIGE